jgi:hypothetical protein
VTRDDHRAECIEAMETGYWKRWEVPSQGDASVREMLTAAFDALPTAGAYVVPCEATEEMLSALFKERPFHAYRPEVYSILVAAGNLANPPEKKP